MASKYLIETLGCQMNVHDSERMAGLLEQAGYESTTDERDADVIVVNTCSVRERAVEKLYARLGEVGSLAGRQGRRPLVAVTGCVAQQEGGRLLGRSNVVDVVVGTHSIKRLPILIDESRRDKAPRIDVNLDEDVSFPLGLARRGDAVKAYVTISEGCSEYCSFCVVPHTRGRERMRPAGEILAEVRDAAATGRREIHLLGQIVNHYRAPDASDCDFATLLERVHEVSGIVRIRFASPHPRHVTARLIGALRDLPKLCKHLHLPVQSGSTSVLKRMRRRHSREEYLDLVARIRDAIPQIVLSTDMIVGFPGETRADFEQTLSLAAAVRYGSVFSFKYSQRPNTQASQHMPDDVPEEEKGRRIAELQALQREIQMAVHTAVIGQVTDVLVDCPSRRAASELSGRTSGNTVVNFPGSPDWLGRLVRVRIKRAGPNSLWGEVDEVEAA